MVWIAESQYLKDSVRKFRLFERCYVAQSLYNLLFKAFLRCSYATLIRRIKWVQFLKLDSVGKIKHLEAFSKIVLAISTEAITPKVFNAKNHFNYMKKSTQTPCKEASLLKVLVSSWSAWSLNSLHLWQRVEREQLELLTAEI